VIKSKKSPKSKDTSKRTFSSLDEEKKGESPKKVLKKRQTKKESKKKTKFSSRQEEEEIESDYDLILDHKESKTYKIKLDQGFKPPLRGWRRKLQSIFKKEGYAYRMYHWDRVKLLSQVKLFMEEYFYIESPTDI
jgi:hypothetical protein